MKTKKKKSNPKVLIEQELVDMYNAGIIEEFVVCVKYKDDRGTYYETAYSGDAGTALVCALHCKSLAKDTIQS